MEILTALERCPLTASQLLKLSRTFKHPFTTERRVRERMQELTQSKLVWRWLYAAARPGAQNYYTLSREGFRVLNGPDAAFPPKRMFGPVGLIHQGHTRNLADFIVHAAVAAHRAGVAFTSFCRENMLRLKVGDESLFPDAAFQLQGIDGQEWNFFVELDNRTERVRSAKDSQSWERKIRLYDSYQDICPFRFRVLVLTTGGDARLRHILETARELVRNPHRSLFCGTTLEKYLAEPEPLTGPCFLDQWQESVSLLPVVPSAQTAFSTPT
jgi:hypothetical protein